MISPCAGTEFCNNNYYIRSLVEVFSTDANWNNNWLILLANTEVTHSPSYKLYVIELCSKFVPPQREVGSQTLWLHN